MTPRQIGHAIVLFAVIVAFGMPAGVWAADADWKAVEQAIGRT